MTTTLLFTTFEHRMIAAQFLAELVRQGVCFKSITSRDECELIITYTGGF